MHVDMDVSGCCEGDPQCCPKEKTVPMIKTLDDLTKGLHEAFAEEKVNIDYVKALLSAYKSNPREWKKFAKFDCHR